MAAIEAVTMKRSHQGFHMLQAMLALLIIGIIWIVPKAGATTIYSYIDDKGNPVYTDAPETIPEKYRAKVKTYEQPNPKATTPSLVQSVQQTVKEQAKNFGFKVPSFQVEMEGFNPTQSRILTYAGALAVVLLVMMYISKSQLVRMLGFCLLVVVGIGAPVLMYVSDGGPMDAMKKKATATGQAQQDRLQQAPQ
ncbi:MAG: DUF4124 domain-containing protein [Nitrospirae bacterium]|nr:DUF4124 domain-containing protein [Nitrospirota bacterium]